MFFINTIFAVNHTINKMVLQQPQHHLKLYTYVYFVSIALARKKKNINTRYLSEEGSGSRLVHRCKCNWTGLCFPVCGDWGGCTCSCSVVAVEDFVFARSAAVLWVWWVFKVSIRVHTQPEFGPQSGQQQSLIDDSTKSLVTVGHWLGHN